MNPLKHWTLDEIISALQEIKEKGWILSNRLHNTGIGKTLEDLLGIEENNIDLPDFGKLELKSNRKDSGSMISLFTKKPDGITNKEILEIAGYQDKTFPEKKALHTTIGKKVNGMGFYYSVDKMKNKFIFHFKNKEMGYYSLDLLREKAMEKLGDGVILVFAKSKKDKETKVESFLYDNAYLLKNFNFDKFLDKCVIEIRMGVYKSGKLKGRLHDHGTSFRIKQKDLSEIFGIYKEII